MCAVGAVGGALGVFYFGWRYLRSRGNMHKAGPAFA